MLSDPYATVQEYKAVTGALSGDHDTQIGLCLEAISRVLDRKLGQSYGFNKDAAASTHVYGPGDSIHPIASTTGLVVKAATGRDITWADIAALTVDEDFELLPRNALAGPEPRPYTAIKLFGWSATPPSVFTPQTYMPDEYRVQVTAIHGWPAVPTAIKIATIELAAMVVGDSVFATSRITEMDQVINASPQARSVLKSLSQSYARFPVVVA